VTFVLDASATLTWLLSDAKAKNRDYATALLEALKLGTVAAVPVTWALEIANVLARGEANGALSEAQSGAFLEMLSGAPIEVDTATFPQALTETLRLARRHRLSSYDASYLELALRNGLPLATLDESLSKAARAAGVKRFNPS
jgi:predicted nucleic acid-binding protein